MKTILIFIVLTMTGISCISKVESGYQGLNTNENRANLDSVQIKSQIVRIIFWNAENLYDPYDDTTKLDDEFTATGSKHWNWTKFRSCAPPNDWTPTRPVIFQLLSH